MPDQVDLTYQGLLRLWASPDQNAGSSIASSHYSPTETGCRMRLRVDQLAVIGSADVGGRAVPDNFGIEWLQGRGSGVVLPLTRLLPVSAQRGKLGIGSTLPSVTVEDEFSSSAAFSDPVLSDEDFILSTVLETRTRVSFQAAIQSDENLVDLTLAAHLEAIRDTLLVEIVTGDGSGNHLNGIMGRAGVGSETYDAAAIGSDAPFGLAENAIEDAGGEPAGMAWLLGESLSNATRTSLLEPGSDRRTEERRRFTLSGTPIQRLGSGIDDTTGVGADWSKVLVPIADELEITVDRISQPGTLKLTSRWAVADPILSRPGAVSVVTEA